MSSRLLYYYYAVNSLPWACTFIGTALVHRGWYTGEDDEFKPVIKRNEAYGGVNAQLKEALVSVSHQYTVRNAYWLALLFGATSGGALGFIARRPLMRLPVYRRGREIADVARRDQC